MQAGRLRHRITIQEPVTAHNGFNEAITTWVTVATVWASVEPISGREFFAAEHVQSEITHRVRVRYRAGIAPTMRVVFDGRHLMIEAVINYGERGTDLQLMCREMAA